VGGHRGGAEGVRRLASWIPIYENRDAGVAELAVERARQKDRVVDVSYGSVKAETAVGRTADVARAMVMVSISPCPRAKRLVRKSSRPSGTGSSPTDVAK
jgi:hypothetical protein